MTKKWVICENHCNPKAIEITSLQTTIAIITENKVIKIFCIADDFCKVFDIVNSPCQRQKYWKFCKAQSLANFRNILCINQLANYILFAECP